MTKAATRPSGIEQARAMRLTVPNISLLKLLHEGPLAQFEIAARMGISKQTAAYNISKLAALRLLERLGPTIHVTGKGRASVKGI